MRYQIGLGKGGRGLLLMDTKTFGIGIFQMMKDISI